ncbi:hypothetical protein [Actinomadura violacea]|uniref:Uncharacterized protein n=1 Tax=Actinomadura violacea TaxID=2819934 RepID=A0ABS3RYB5_9ACTN|nr:hypothetical protein [Actinomadura violacea]MBO2461749.1 hypothetical protein [Actinomadura violacea]
MLVYKAAQMDWQRNQPRSFVPYGQHYERGVWYTAACALPSNCCPDGVQPVDETLGVHPDGNCGFWSFADREAAMTFLAVFCDDERTHPQLVVWEAEAETVIPVYFPHGTVIRSRRIRLDRPIAWNASPAGLRSPHRESGPRSPEATAGRKVAVAANSPASACSGSRRPCEDSRG